jgi:hypothetical protein
LSAKGPGKFQAIVYMQLISGILAVLGQGLAVIFTCGMWLIFLVPIYAIVTGIMAIMSGVKGLGEEPRHDRYRTVAIMQIVAIIAGDVISCACGIVAMIFLNDPEVKSYLEG